MVARVAQRWYSGNALPLCTCTPIDFSGMDDLDVVAVPHHRTPLLRVALRAGPTPGSLNGA
jgi:hypothetical protein